MTSNSPPRIAAVLLVLSALGGCSTTYSSRDECERAEAAYRGRAIGFMVAAAASPSGQTVVRQNGVTKVTTHGGSNLGVLALGTLAGHFAGEALHERSRDGTPDDTRPHTGNWYGRCAPDPGSPRP